MKSDIKIDMREFTASMRAYQRATKKDEADILNRAGKNVAMRAAQFTPKAAAGKIKSTLISNNLAIRILAARGKFKGVPLSERGAVVKKFISARVRSVRYIAAGWAKAIHQLGGRAQAVNQKSEAAKGYAKPATANTLAVIIANNSRGAGKVGLKPLQEAINFVARDMLSYAQKKLAQTAKKHSAKGAR